MLIQIRLIDLGNANRGLQDPANPHRGRAIASRYYCGTPGRQPPETLGDRDAPCQPFLGDVWALGILLYSMVTGIPVPFWTTEMSLGGVESLYKFDELCETEPVAQVLPVLRRCLEVDPSKRATMDDLTRLFK